MKNKNSTFHMSFGDLEIGDHFVFFNPHFHAKPNLMQPTMVKASQRTYVQLDIEGNICAKFQTGSKTGVCRI